MIIGERLRVLRESKNLSQGEVEKRTGLLPLLHVACRERSHCPLGRDTGKIRAGARNSDLSFVL